jgi:short-subunit dehydrogenase
LVQRGYRVGLIARRADVLERLANELGGARHAVVLPTDLAVPEERDKLAARVQGLDAEVEILVNNAGFGVFSPFAESDRLQELKQVRVLVEAVVDLMARYLPGMVSRGRGAVINVASTSGFQALPYNAGYAAAKSHVLLLSEAVHAEVKEHGVTVTAVCPGPVATGFQEVADASYFQKRLPKFTHVSAERVARDSLSAAEQGRISVIPGGPPVRAAFAPNRALPRWLTLPVSKRLMKR